MRARSVSTLLLITAVGAGLAAPPGFAHGSTDLDVLYIGAHPDDEASSLSTLGQWGQRRGIRTGVVTVTRGEGGGNAIGPEEGPSLGLLREGEERRAVAKAGITDVYNLDEADLYYTVSAPLTEQAWQHDDVLGKLVRVVRQTRPEVVVTMDPAPTPGNHGNHQYAARLALEAYHLAGDASAFPGQVTDEGLRPWSVRRVLSRDERTGVPGRECEAVATPPSAPGRLYGVWAGRRTTDNVTWAQRERAAEREYATQGWSDRPDIDAPPERIGCDYFLELANRVPHAPAPDVKDAALQGALVATPGSLPLGTGFVVTPDRPRIVPGATVRVRVKVTAPEQQGLPAGEVTVKPPLGWEINGQRAFGPVAAGRSVSLGFKISVPATHPIERVTVPVSVVSGEGSGSIGLRFDTVAPVVAEQEPLPAVREFRNWAASTGFPLLADATPPVWTVPSGGSEPVGVVVRNNGDSPRSGVVRMRLPRGFAAAPAQRGFQDVEPGATKHLVFRVSNTDPSMPTGMQGGDHFYTLETESDMKAQTRAALEIVPTTTIFRAHDEPTVDGRLGEKEYSNTPLDLSPRWEGDPCRDRADCSAKAKLTWHGDDLYAIVDVVDDVAGTRLPPVECKRHWRTDSVEIALDPAGQSENTSSTFKLAVLPSTDDPQAGNPPCFARDADNYQGPGEQTAPGVRVASTVRPGGYTVEAAIPLSALPGSVDPRRLGLNLLVYDSDTQDKTGQTRIGWSTWEGVQGDPYRWGSAVLAQLSPEQPSPPPPPRLPLHALSSLDSPTSVAQAVRLGTSLGATAHAGPRATTVTGAQASPDVVQAMLSMNGPGTLHLFVVDEAGVVLGDKVVRVEGHGRSPVSIEYAGGIPYRILAGFRSPDGATGASARLLE